MEESYKYFAFLSYSSHDMAWGKRLQRRLEGYRLPTTLCSARGWPRKPMRPVFFAPTDIQPGGLDQELQDRLRASRHLIVICSPHLAQSAWVGREIEYFHSLGRAGRIHLFIVEGTPHSGNPQTECFNPVIDRLGLPELLGANIHEHIYRWGWLNRERAYVQLVTKLLGIEFDAIWQRHKRRLATQVAAGILGGAAVCAAVTGAWLANRPVDVTVRLHEATVHNVHLPPLSEAVVSLRLDNELKTDTLASLADEARFLHVPRRFLGREVSVSIRCRDFLDVDTLWRLEAAQVLPVSRDAAVYGQVRFRLWSPDTEQAVPHCDVWVQGVPTRSDATGQVELSIPLSSQRTAYPVRAAVALEDSVVYMPTGPGAVVLTASAP